MKIDVTLPYSTSEIVGDRSFTLSFEQQQVSLVDIIDFLSKKHGDEVKKSLIDSEGQLQYIVFINGKSQDLSEPLNDGDHVVLLDPIAGG